MAFLEYAQVTTLQRLNTENSKQIVPDKELGGLSPNFHFHVSVPDLYISRIGLPILLQENMWTCAANFSLLNLPKGKSLGRSKPATNS